MQQLALVEANNFYVFDYIDPPAVMETKSEPIRSLICIIGALLGGIIGCLVVIIRFFASNQKPNHLNHFAIYIKNKVDYLKHNNKHYLN